ncbi:MAG: hypothetical protein EOO16_10585 [Chitinophagaceae bacterium]|nr:MAG: hypothetical protein EOO16_10585 [Chitinophagaceae bacterium]
MLRRLIFFLNLLLFSLFLNAQQKTLTALRVAVAPRIDGSLDEEAWQSATAATGFIQNYPAAGKPASHSTKVYVLYDDAALYIGAYLYDDPVLIRRQLTQRDGEARQDVDFFSVFLDTYNDKQNGFEFGVTSSNVQSDARYGGSSDNGDKTWDAVWQSSTSIKSDGWVVEMRIPYISLRFTPQEVQTWGLQFLRLTRRDNENAFWSAVDPKVNGFVNQFGQLEGLRGIRAPLRLSFSPYLSGGVRFNPAGSSKRTEILRSGGMDVKWGINRSFTLDATLIPDFGQVVSDNVVNNLTPYEIRFQENRPFFTEGTELFNKSGIFYSRRIGATPIGYSGVESTYGASTSPYEIVRNPSLTRLYNAIKLSGRTDKKLGIGVFNAVTAPMDAKLRNRQTGEDSLVRTEPMANYNLFVLDQAFKGRSFITLTNANVIRDGATRDANTTAFDWGLFDRSNKYSVSGTLRYSNIFGYTPYASQYFYNTDTVTLADGRRYLRPYDGFSGRLRLAKVSGNIRYNGQVNIESEHYDPNDMGYLQAPNEVTYSAGISYQQFEATRTFINYNYGLTLYHTSLFHPNRFSSFEAVANGYVIFKNFWDISVQLGAVPQVQYDFFELRKWGLQLARPAFYYGNIYGSSDSRKKLYVSFGFGYEHSTLAHSPYNNVNIGVRYRFSNRLTLSLDVARQQDDLQIGSAYLRDAAVIGYRDYKDITGVLSGIYNFTPRMNITMRARHYWSRAHYLSFYQVDEKGGHQPLPYVPGQDFNYNVFNLDAFYTWDFRPGSRIILGWKNWANGTYAIDGIANRRYLRNLGRTFGLAHGNELSLRVIYFLDYNQLRGKR